MPSYQYSIVNTTRINYYGEMLNPAFVLENQETGKLVTAEFNKNWQIYQNSYINNFIENAMLTYERLSNSQAVELIYQKRFNLREYSKKGTINIEPALRLEYDYRTETGKKTYSFTADKFIVYIDMIGLNNTTSGKLNSNWNKPPNVYQKRSGSKVFFIDLENLQTVSSITSRQYFTIKLGFDDDTAGTLQVDITEPTT